MNRRYRRQHSTLRTARSRCPDLAPPRGTTSWRTLSLPSTRRRLPHRSLTTSQHGDCDHLKEILVQPSVRVGPQGQGAKARGARAKHPRCDLGSSPVCSPPRLEQRRSSLRGPVPARCLGVWRCGRMCWGHHPHTAERQTFPTTPDPKSLTTFHHHCRHQRSGSWDWSSASAWSQKWQTRGREPPQLHVLSRSPSARWI